MIPKKKRLPSKEFDIGSYRTVRTPYFLLKFKKNNENAVRVGVIAGVSVHKSAVRRNFWKRQAKMIVQASKNDNKDLLVILFSKINTLTKKQFKEKLVEALASTH